MNVVIEILKIIGDFFRNLRILQAKGARDEFKDKADKAVKDAIENNDTSGLEDLSRRK